MSVVVKKKGKITTVIINRPEVRNAVDYPTALALANAFREFDKDEDSHVAVLYGAGGNFCSGADLKAINSDSKNKNSVAEDGDGPMGPTRLKLSKPVIAAVSGYAVAGGLELALWCDLRVCEESSIFGVFCRRWGVPLIDGGTIRLPRLIGLSRALDMILTGRPVKADEAYLMGLANRVVKDGTVLEEAEKLASEIAEFPQICMRHDRMSAIEQFDYTLDDAIKNELIHGMHALKSKEMMDGIRRFVKGVRKHKS